MNSGLIRTVVAAGDAAAAAAVVRASETLAVRAGAVPGLAAEIAADGVLLRGRGLVARAFGSRRRTADPRIAGLGRGETG